MDAVKAPLFDVVAVNIATKKIRLLDQGKTAKNAEAIVLMAVIFRGVDDEFFVDVPSGKYHDGDDWAGR